MRSPFCHRSGAAGALVWALAAALAALAGCGQEVARAPLLDLVAGLPLAEVHPAPAPGASEAGGALPAGAVDGISLDLMRVSGDTLLIPFGSRVDFFLEPPAEAAFTLDRLGRRGEAAGWLEVWVTVEGGEPRRLARLESSAREQAILGGENGTIRLSLAAVAADGGARQDAGMLLAGPRLTAPTASLPRPAAADEVASGIDGVPPRPPPGRRSNVIVYMIDTLRADHLGCYGYDRPVSPAIDAFAGGATLFENAVAQSPWTRPSVASILTGVWPKSHGVNGRKDTLAPEAVTLPEVLSERGYETAGFITNRNVARAFGFAQGFDLYAMMPKGETSSRDVHQRATEWLDGWRQGGDRAPFFLYLHTVDPHAPYLPEASFRQRFAAGVGGGGIGQRWWMKQLKTGEIPVTEKLVADLLALYDAEIAENDASFGELMGWLEETGLLEDTVVILVSDHGEEFHEHGRWEHGKSLHTELLDVPLIVRLPGSAAASTRGQRVSAPVQHIDLMPTLLSYLGVPAPAGVEGRDLMPLLTGRQLAGSAPSELCSYVDLDGFEAASVTTGRWRLIDGRSAPHGFGRWLYDRLRDPRELDDRAPARPVTAGYLRSRLAARELATEVALAPGEVVLDDDLREQLRALGYLD